MNAAKATALPILYEHRRMSHRTNGVVRRSGWYIRGYDLGKHIDASRQFLRITEYWFLDRSGTVVEQHRWHRD